MHRLAAIALFATLPVTAQAGTCESPYDFDTLLNDLGAAEAGLRAMDYAAAMQSAQAMRDGLPCLDQVLPIIIAPRALRAIAAGLYVGGEPEEAARWFRSALELDPGFDYAKQGLPTNHPIVRAWGSVRSEAAQEAVVAEDLELGEGKHWLDGKPLETPAATPEAMHVYQYQTDAVRTWVIEGNAFPREATGWLPEPEPAPITAVVLESGQPTLPSLPPPSEIRARAWPTERVALVGGGIAALAGSGVLYALSADARGRFDSANTQSDLDHWRSQTNAYAVGSGATFVAGASALGLGALFFLIDGDPRPSLDLRF